MSKRLFSRDLDSGASRSKDEECGNLPQLGVSEVERMGTMVARKENEMDQRRRKKGKRQFGKEEP